MRHLLLALVVAVAFPAAAQDRGVLGVIEGRQASAGGYYVNAQPGEPVTRVNVWGQVLRPGVYDVGPDFDLGGVLTLAGVAAERGGDPARLDLVVRLFRAGEAAPVYQAFLHDVVREAVSPDVRYGDVVEVRAEGVARVAVWGAVARPGVYEVGPTVSARDVLALAGGPEIGTLRPSQSQETTVLVYRGDAAAPRYEASLEAFLADDPALADGDVLQVETRIDQGWTTRDTFAVGGLITSAAIAVVQFLRLVNTD